jgi:hypothetical protein
MKDIKSRSQKSSWFYGDCVIKPFKDAALRMTQEFPAWRILMPFRLRSNNDGIVVNSEQSPPNVFAVWKPKTWKHGRLHWVWSKNVGYCMILSGTSQLCNKIQ